MQHTTSYAHCTQRDEPQEADVMPWQLERMDHLTNEIGVLLGAMEQDAEIIGKADPLLTYYRRRLKWIRDELRCERDTLRQDLAAKPAPVVGRDIEALRSIAEGNLGDGPGQANYALIREFVDAVLSTRPAESVAPVVTASLIKRARAEYRDSDAAGDVLDWMEEQLGDETVAHGGEAFTHDVHCPQMNRPCTCKRTPTPATDSGGEVVAEVYAGAFGTRYIACADPTKLPVGTKLYAYPNYGS